jgi:hypothetical protein
VIVNSEVDIFTVLGLPGSLQRLPSGGPRVGRSAAMSYIPEESPDENEQYENLDEALDEQDLPGHGGGPEGGRDIDDLVADRTALEEAGADLDDPERISMLGGAMDDPDGSGPPEEQRSEAGIGTGDSSDAPDTDPELELIDTDATEMDQVPDDAPGPDSARR